MSKEILSRLDKLEKFVREINSESLISRFKSLESDLKKDTTNIILSDISKIEKRAIARAYGCSHSFNQNDECEYCGLSEEAFEQHGIGTYE